MKTVGKLTTVNHNVQSSPLTEVPSSHLHLKSDGGESWAEEQREELGQILTSLDGLDSDIQKWNTTTVDDDLVNSKTKEVEELEKEAVEKLSTPIPPLGLSMPEFKASIKMFFNLPLSYRLALVKAIDLEDTAAADPARIPDIVTKLYEQQYTITQKRLADCLKEAPAKQMGVTKIEGDDLEKMFQNLFENGEENGEEKTQDQRDLESSVRQFLPRVIRKEDNVPLESDAELLFAALDKETFSSSARPIQIPGGYIIRGENRKKSGEELISALDAKFPADWDCTVSYMYDVSAIDGDDDNMFELDSALVLLKKDFTPIANEWFYRITSLVSFGTLLLFCVGVYGGNQDVLKKLSDASSLGDFAALDWFNGKVGQVLLPILAILASHELGHFIVAKKDKIETTSLIPTFLPCFGSLPLLGTLTRIKTSPKNFTSLFDFAFMGPLLGFVSSIAFLGAGLAATKTALDGDASAAAQFLPSLPVSVLSLSTLGGSIIDNFFAGGDGYITAMDPATPVPLHPFAIAGYAGLLINAAEMLPLGATDGGRMSMTIFGRRGHSLIGGLTWFALLVTSFSLKDQQTALIITAWATNNIFQNDMEIPCRDESQNPSLPRISAAFALWFLAALAITPMAVALQ
jgi:hypothetical protein